MRFFFFDGTAGFYHLQYLFTLQLGYWEHFALRKHPSRGVLIKSCSKNEQQFYRRTPTPKCDFNKVASNFIEIALRHGLSSANLLHIFQTSFPKNTCGRLLLTLVFLKGLHCLVLFLFLLYTWYEGGVKNFEFKFFYIDNRNVNNGINQTSATDDQS